MPTIFTGFTVLPKRFADLKYRVEIQLTQEVQKRYEEEILKRPHVDIWSFGEHDGEYFVTIFTTKPIEEIDPQELKELQKPVGDFRVRLEFFGLGIPNVNEI